MTGKDGHGESGETVREIDSERKCAVDKTQL